MSTQSYKAIIEVNVFIERFDCICKDDVAIKFLELEAEAEEGVSVMIGKGVAMA